MLVVLLIAGAATLTGIWSIASSPNFKILDATDIEKLSQKSKQEVLDSFDLVTEGAFAGSQYYVIRTWQLEIADLTKIAEALGGHLVSINSEEENEFVFALSMKDPGHWRHDRPDRGFSGPLIGLIQVEGAHEPDGGWGWMNNDPLIYTNWRKFGPENAEGHQSLAMFWGRNAPSADWDDIDKPQWSIIVEVEGNQ